MKIYKLLLTQSAFTLVELTVIVIVIGILASLALPLFSRAVEATKGQEAVVGLRQIRTGQRNYRVEENTYYGSSVPITDGATINQILTLDLTINQNWDYSIDSADATSFTAKATRRSGKYDGKYISINQDGDIEGNWELPIPSE